MMSHELIKLFFQQRYHQQTGDFVLFEQWEDQNDRKRILRVSSSDMSLERAKGVAKKLMDLLPDNVLIKANVAVVSSHQELGKYHVQILNPEALYHFHIKNDGKILSFLQSLYNHKSCSRLEFQIRTINSGLRKAFIIVSLAMDYEQVNQVIKNLEEILPPVAKINRVESNQVRGTFRAMIANPIDVFSFYHQKMADKLNEVHPLPNQPMLFDRSHTWTCPRNSLGYKTNVASQYRNLNSSLESQAEWIQKINDYNNTLQVRYPGLKIGVEHHRDGDAYLIEQFSYENYTALENAKNTPLTLKESVLLFFVKNPHEFTSVKKELISNDLSAEVDALIKKQP